MTLKADGTLPVIWNGVQGSSTSFHFPEDCLIVTLPNASRQAPRQRVDDKRRLRGRAGHQRADVDDLGSEKVNVALTSYIMKPQ